jgi:alpha-tubulin suppressor-like RCC1 family protein
MPCGARAGATASCVASRCEYTCRDGLGDCNGMAADGCEASTRTLTNCGVCGMPCGFANASASCTTGTCAFVACTAGFGDCDGDLSNGCERPLDTITSCGMCGRVCSFAHAAASCTLGSCVRGACDMGWDDCNGMPSDGCEADLASTSTCGMCGRACMGGQMCVGGACTMPPSVVEVGAGLAFSCARLSDGRVFCWGDDASGQLGNGAAAASSSPVAVMGLTDAIDLAVGALHACAVRMGGSVVCWGDNQRFQVGDGMTTDRPAPVAAGGISNAVRVSAGGEHTCVVRAGGAVSCWGRDNVGQLGDGTRGGDRGNGVDVTLPATATDVDCGAAHTCALLSSGEVHCWGENGASQLGDGSAMDRDAPVRAGTLTGAVGISTGADFTCAVRSGGTIQCWGANDHGQLGDGTTAGRGTLANVDLLTDAVEVSCGADHTCARNAAGAVSCWGFNAGGRLGDGTTTERTRPVSVSGVTATQLSAGAEHTCAARTDGAASCWGANAAGQLGLGTTMGSSTPTRVTGLP